MKSYLFLAITALLVACSPTPQAGGGTLSDLKAEKEDLKSQLKELNLKLKAIDSQLEKLDTTKTERLANVSTVKINIEPFEHYFEIQGQVEADKNVNLTSEASGVIQKLVVSEGQRVSKGDLLVQLDQSLIEENIAELKEQIKLAEFVFEKQDRLWKQNIGSELEYRQAKTNLSSLKQRLSQTNLQRSKQAVYAPFSGVIDEIFVKVGELASPGLPIARLVNLDRLEVVADVSEKYVGVVKKNSAVKISLPSINKEVEARIYKTGSYINPANRTFEVAALIPNQEGDLLPNLVAKLKVRDYFNGEAVVVPLQSVLQDITGNNYVYVVETNNEVPRIKKVAVEPGISYDNKIEIISGLNGTEEVVLDGARSVNEGDRVSVAQATIL